MPLVYRFTSEDLPEPENLRVLRAMFTDPDSLRPTRTVESVTEEAARRFARLVDGMRAWGVEPHEAAHFLNKLLFCLFAEDIRLLPKGLFTWVVERGVRRPESFNGDVGTLIEAMRDGGEFSQEAIPRFNGGLYESGQVVPLTSEEIRLLLEAARLDWGAVEPAIFGTLFERSLDPSQRVQIGAHYTGREDILAVVEPVLMAPLRREWEEVREKAGAEAEKGRTLSGRAATNALRRAESLLLGFAEKLRGVCVLDPACGSGNFLYVCLKKLLDLEKEVSAFVGAVGLTPFFPEVSPEQLYGIETSPYAHELAQVAVWIGYLQWNVENSFGVRDEPILGPTTNIKEMDALMARDENGEVRESEWPEADMIVGNPPFLGGKKMRAELGDEYVVNLRKLYSGQVSGWCRPGDLLVREIARVDRVGEGRRAGLLATQGIYGGAYRLVLQRTKETGDIFFVESDRPWVSNGAAVRVFMVVFDDGSEKEKMLDGAQTVAINPNLTGRLDLTQAIRLAENANIAFQGPVMVGPFDIEPTTAEEFLRHSNPHEHPNSEVVFPFTNAADITGRRQGRYIIDFEQRSEENASLYEAPVEYVKQHVKPLRDKYRDRQRKEVWWKWA